MEVVHLRNSAGFPDYLDVLRIGSITSASFAVLLVDRPTGILSFSTYQAILAKSG
jgi:hypothetical protein